ncbi:hypothetical protein [Halomonas halocynthiae]|uniref:hypothetical protein n=1 Tax=Halomonas halocynthiae TaxID=176290 RepID=UPI000402B619|nr:hypothetical protein [Halomonas halocynthiae]
MANIRSSLGSKATCHVFLKPFSRHSFKTAAKTKPQRLLLSSALVLALALSPLVLAQSWDASSSELLSRWEHITTAMDRKDREQALESLAAEASALVEANPANSDLLIVDGIVQASLAREVGGLDALGAAKHARNVLERAVEIDADGHAGSAYVTLGALYDRAPGWPVAFGDSETAEQMFQRALEIRPDGMDVNYYYAAFLAEEGRNAEAIEHARRAEQGAPRADRQASDKALKNKARVLRQKLGG